MRRSQKFVLLGVLVAASALGSAWILPPLLDWGRYRATISDLTAAALGRPVLLRGQIRLSLLPQLVLTADNVALPDEGDGVFGTLGALRLQLAIGPLLSGHLVIRDLVLGAPRITLPWPVPGKIAGAMRPRVVHELAAHMEGGTLFLGALRIGDIEATLRVDPFTGAFSADGSAAALGRPWHFSTLLAAPGQDGVTGLDVAIDGQGPVQNTGGTFKGQIQPTGTVAGLLTMRGPDFSALLPGPAIQWSLQGQVIATGRQIQAPQLNLLLDTTPAQADVQLTILPAASAEVAVQGAQINLDGWYRALSRRAGPPLPGLNVPTRLDIKLQAADFLGDTARDVRLALSLAPGRTRLDQISAMLPGGTELGFEGATGTANLSSSNFSQTAAWLRPVMPSVWANLASHIANQVTLHAQLQFEPGRASLTDLTGSLNGAAIAGTGSADWGQMPRVTAELRQDQIDLATLRAALPAMLDAWQAGSGDWALRLKYETPRARWGETNLGALALSLARQAVELSLDATLAGPGGQARGAATIGADGSLMQASLAASVANIGDWRRFLPQGWQHAAGGLAGPASMAARAAGKLGALAGQFRADAGDLRLEADTAMDLPGRKLDGTLTLRHPDAPKLLAQLGYENAEDWLDTGSLAVLMHVQASPGAMVVPEFDLTAGALRLGGDVRLDLSGAEPGLTGHVRAGSLNLPPLAVRWGTPLSTAWLAGWHGAVRVQADSVLLDRVGWATDLSTDLALQSGQLTASSFRADFLDGTISGDARFDAAAVPPAATLRVALSGVSVPQRLTGWPTDIGGGKADLSVRASAVGDSPASLLATLSGDVSGALRDSSVDGLDLARAAGLSKAQGSQAHRALARLFSSASGSTDSLDGTFAGQLSRGVWLLDGSSLTGKAGTVAAAGSIDLPDGSLDVQLMLQPAGAADPPILLSLLGPWQSPKRVVTLPSLAGPARASIRRRKAH